MQRHLERRRKRAAASRRERDGRVSRATGAIRQYPRRRRNLNQQLIDQVLDAGAVGIDHRIIGRGIKRRPYHPKWRLCELRNPKTSTNIDEFEVYAHFIVNSFGDTK